MAQPVEITHPAVHGHYAALVTHPGYYYLYALYADYALNNTWFQRRGYAALLAERLRTIQPLLALVQPYRKSPALRLFTERRSRERFPVERANEAWRELRALIERLGEPSGWPHTPPPEPPYAHALPRGARRRKPPGATKRAAPRKALPRLPKSPVDYSRDA
jgi:hypothetical protein